MQNPLKSLARTLAAFRPQTKQISQYRYSRTSTLHKDSAGNPTTTRHPTDIRELLRQSAEALGAQLRPAEVAIHLELPSGPLTVSLDRARVREVLAHIVQLASAVMPKGSTLKLLARMEGAQAVVNFMDIAPDGSEPRLGRCFGRSSQQNHPANALSPDLISGALRCEQIVGDHGGRIYSAPSPLGSLGITLRLPLCHLSGV